MVVEKCDARGNHTYRTTKLWQTRCYGTALAGKSTKKASTHWADSAVVVYVKMVRFKREREFRSSFAMPRRENFPTTHATLFVWHTVANLAKETAEHQNRVVRRKLGRRFVFIVISLLHTYWGTFIGDARRARIQNQEQHAMIFGDDIEPRRGCPIIISWGCSSFKHSCWFAG